MLGQVVQTWAPFVIVSELKHAPHGDPCEVMCSHLAVHHLARAFVWCMLQFGNTSTSKPPPSESKTLIIDSLFACVVIRFVLSLFAHADTVSETFCSDCMLLCSVL